MLSPKGGKRAVMRSVVELLAALALFLLGLALLGRSLQHLAGGWMETALRRWTGSRSRGLGLGLGMTALLQSSSAVTVMAVSLADAGLLTPERTRPLIVGANVGTTVTAWLLCLEGEQPEAVSLLIAALAAAGLVLVLLPGRRNLGGAAWGLALLLLGMEGMTAAAAPLAQWPPFLRLMGQGEGGSAWLALLAGTVCTGVLQSSSASVGLLQALSFSGQVTWSGAVPLLMGQNIGTCVTALLAGAAGGANARRTARFHLWFNVVGVAVFFPLWLAAEHCLGVGARPIGAVGIAAFHTGFNVASGVLWLLWERFGHAKGAGKRVRCAVRD